MSKRLPAGFTSTTLYQTKAPVLEVSMSSSYLPYLYTFTVLYSLLTVTRGVSYKCEVLDDQTCFGSTLNYNFTTLQLVTDSHNQGDVESNLKQWEGLKFLSKCWSVLQPLLCQVYKPRCQNSSVRLPCREQCDATRKPCSVVERYHKKWPEFLQCERFPEGGCEVSYSKILINMYISIAREVVLKYSLLIHS